MDLDALLHHYFGTDDPDSLGDVPIQLACARMAVDLGVEREPGRRFALWALMVAFDCAPRPAEAFEDPGLRRAAEEYLDAVARMAEAEDEGEDEDEDEA